jgi:hypothetical protein
MPRVVENQFVIGSKLEGSSIYCLQNFAAVPIKKFNDIELRDVWRGEDPAKIIDVVGAKPQRLETIIVERANTNKDGYVAISHCASLTL